MKSIVAKKIKYSLWNEIVGEKEILKEVSFKCDQNERLCIFGENGAGKSTLLKILDARIGDGESEILSGSIEKTGHVRTFYVGQEFDQNFLQKNIGAYVEVLAGKSLYKKVFDYGRLLGFDLEKNSEKLCSELSGGQQKILVLSVAFAICPDFLFLDEPENHLDIVSRTELMGMMADFSGGIIFVSHDRLLIDSVVTKIGELVGGVMYISEGNYDDYIAKKTERLETAQDSYDKISKRIKTLQAMLVILKKKAIRSNGQSAYHRALNELEELRREHGQVERPRDKKTKINLSLDNNNFHHGRRLWQMKNGGFKFENMKHRIFGETDLEIRSGDRIVLLGRNGKGKTTFLRCLTGETQMLSGESIWADKTAWSYFDQHCAFAADQTPIKIVQEKLACGETDAKAALGMMKFDDKKMITKVGQLSGGERMRIRFALAFGKKPDLIILDEPTNHIDEITWEILVAALDETKSAVLLVTHDYEFIEEFEPSKYWTFSTDNKVLERHKTLDELLDEMRG